MVAVFGRITNDAGGAFSTIQSAIDGTAPGGTITLSDGTYNESNIHVNKPLTIQGEHAGSAILGPSIADDHTDSAFGGSVSNAFIIESSNVNLLKILVDGNADGTISGVQNFRAA